MARRFPKIITKRMTVHLDPIIIDRVKEVAMEKPESISALVEHALEAYPPLKLEFVDEYPKLYWRVKDE